MRRGPLTPYEIEIVRGLIDEHVARRAREKVIREFWTRGRVIVVAGAAIVMWFVVVASAIVSMRGR